MKAEEVASVGLLSRDGSAACPLSSPCRTRVHHSAHAALSVNNSGPHVEVELWETETLLGYNPNTNAKCGIHHLPLRFLQLLQVSQKRMANWYRKQLVPDCP